MICGDIKSSRMYRVRTDQSNCRYMLDFLTLAINSDAGLLQSVRVLEAYETMVVDLLEPNAKVTKAMQDDIRQLMQTFLLQLCAELDRSRTSAVDDLIDVITSIISDFTRLGFQVILSDTIRDKIILYKLSTSGDSE
jgi:hypothetical protein